MDNHMDMNGDLPFDISAKRMQSELGATGDYSPNIEFVIKSFKEMHDNFEHVHGTITNNDAFLAVSKSRVGTDITKTDNIYATMMAVRGCYNDMEDMFVTLLCRKPQYIQIFQRAMARAIHNLHHGGGEEERDEQG